MSTVQYTTLLWEDGVSAQTYSVRIDATVSESHVFANTVTDHPIERGAALTDHVRPNPARLTITGMVSNHPFVLPADHIGPAVEETRQTVDVRIAPRVRVIPIVPPTAVLAPLQRPDVAVTTRISRGYSTSATVVTFSNSFDRARAVFDSLVTLRDNGTLIRVVTSLRDYPSMVIESLTVPRDAATGEALVFDIALKQVITATLQQVAVPAAKGPRTKKAITVTETQQAADNIWLGALKDSLQ